MSSQGALPACQSLTTTACVWKSHREDFSVQDLPTPPWPPGVEEAVLSISDSPGEMKLKGRGQESSEGSEGAKGVSMGEFGGTERALGISECLRGKHTTILWAEIFLSLCPVCVCVQGCVVRVL